MKTKTNKLNWNSLTDDQQSFIDNIVNREVFTSCNELISEAEEIYFENDYNEETDTYYEIFQYFIVSKWLYEQLDKINACITKLILVLLMVVFYCSSYCTFLFI